MLITESGFTFIFAIMIVVGVIHLLYNILANTESKIWETIDTFFIILGGMAFNYPDEYMWFMETYLKIIIE